MLDRRGEGVLGTVSELLSTGEPLLVACADVSRRRALFAQELAAERFGRPPAACVSARCARDSVAELGGFASALCVAEHAAVEREPGLPPRFKHVFVLDPPPFAHRRERSTQGAPAASGEGFLHLGWGAAELDFSRKVLEHEFVLARPAGVALPGACRGGRHAPRRCARSGARAATARTPVAPLTRRAACACWASSASSPCERSSATVRCTITSEERVELERSSAVCAYARTLRRRAFDF